MSNEPIITTLPRPLPGQSRADTPPTTLPHPLPGFPGPPAILWRRRPEGKSLPLPSYITEGAAGMDVRAAERGFLIPGTRTMVSTGFDVQIPHGTVLWIVPRSGLAYKKGLTLINSPGVLDCDYTGMLGLLLVNLGAEKIEWEIGDRLAQVVLMPVITAVSREVEELGSTVRGANGFGHTGVV